MKKHKINYKLIDNLFVDIDNFPEAQLIADKLKVKIIPNKLDQFFQQYCPKKFGLYYYWSIMQAEYATAIVFKSQNQLKAIYDNLIRIANHTVKPQKIATFPGKNSTATTRMKCETISIPRIEGTRIKHIIGSTSVKMYDKFALSLRIETTVNDISFFKHYCKVEHRYGTQSLKMAAIKKHLQPICPL